MHAQHVGLVFLCSSRLPEDDTPVLKHVGVDTPCELYFIICMLVYFIGAFVG